MSCRSGVGLVLLIFLPSVRTAVIGDLASRPAIHTIVYECSVNLPVQNYESSVLFEQLAYAQMSL